MIAVVPAVLAFLLLGAHFHRAGLALLVPVCVALAVVACLPRRWAVRLAQAALVLASLEWMRTLFAFAGARVAQDRPVLRLVLIIGAVIVFTLWAAWLLRSRARAPAASSPDALAARPAPGPDVSPRD